MLLWHTANQFPQNTDAAYAGVKDSDGRLCLIHSRHLGFFFVIIAHLRQKYNLAAMHPTPQSHCITSTKITSIFCLEITKK